MSSVNSVILFIFVLIIPKIVFCQKYKPYYIASIEVESKDKNISDESGSAFLLGYDDKNIYLGTVFHVVKFLDDKTPISIAFFERLPITGYVYKPKENMDFAVIVCEKPNQWQNISQIKPSKTLLEANTEVIVVGNPYGSLYDVNRDCKIKESSYDLDERLFTISPVGIMPGQSGGVVLDKEYNFLGVIKSVTNMNAICIKRSFISKFCTKWGIPSSLIHKERKPIFMQPPMLIGELGLLAAGGLKLASLSVHNSYEEDPSNLTKYDRANFLHKASIVLGSAAVLELLAFVIKNKSNKKKKSNQPRLSSLVRPTFGLNHSPNFNAHVPITMGIKVRF